MRESMRSVFIVFLLSEIVWRWIDYWDWVWVGLFWLFAVGAIVDIVTEVMKRMARK